MYLLKLGLEDSYTISKNFGFMINYPFFDKRIDYFDILKT